MKADQLIRRIEIRDKSGKVIGTKDVVTYSGLLSKAHDEGLIRVRTHLIQVPTEENGRTAIAKAIVETAKGRFDGIGDASPENVNSFIVPHLIRVAETRAKARALRDAVNIGVVSFEELNGDGIPDEQVSRRAQRSEEPRPARPRVVDTPVARESAKDAVSASVLMSESQRRYLFRLLAAQGLIAEAAHLRLKELFAVDSLLLVTKAKATELIDRIITGFKVGEPGGRTQQ
jgi:hypothetical protein